MQTLNYKTTRSKVIRNALLRNIAMSIVGTALLAYAWMAEGGLVFGLGCVLSAVIAGFTALVYKATETPLEIKDGTVIISSLLSTTIPLAKVTGIGQHPARKTPSLTYNDLEKKHSGELVLPWKFIAESETEVVAKLQAAIDASRA